MNIIQAFPPNYAEIEKVFDIRGKNIVFAYGDVLYNPRGADITNDLMVHEETHKRQQGNDPASWWSKYLKDVNFRLNQEVEAYRNQFQFYKQKHKHWMPFLQFISKDLSGKMYGNIISFVDAMSAISAE